jgi:hypothetical protein
MARAATEQPDRAGRHARRGTPGWWPGGGRHAKGGRTWPRARGRHVMRRGAEGTGERRRALIVLAAIAIVTALVVIAALVLSDRQRSAPSATSALSIQTSVASAPTSPAPPRDGIICVNPRTYASVRVESKGRVDDRVRPGERMLELSRSGDYATVRTPRGVTGTIPVSALISPGPDRKCPRG